MRALLTGTTSLWLQAQSEKKPKKKTYFTDFKKEKRTGNGFDVLMIVI